MSVESRVSSFGKSSARIVEVVSSILRCGRRKIPRFARANKNSDGKREEVVLSTRDNQHATLDTRSLAPETFFDTEFLRKLERLHLIAKRLTWAGARGEHTASRKGFSLEFSDYRRYQHGDDLRYVDWNIYRRLERLLLKVFTAEEEMNIYLLVDASRSMAEGTPAKIDYAKKVAAALGYIGLKNLDRVGGASFSERLHAPLTLGRGRKQILSLFSFLTKLSCAHETNLRAAIHAFTNLFPHPGFVVIVSDLFDPAGHPKPWGDVALVDVEGGRERKFFLDEDLVRRFQAELAGYFKEIETVCANRQIDYLRTSTQVPFDDFVLRTLRRASCVA